jgi:putative transcriptional regulator
MKTRLRVLRAEKEWSQEELASRVGVTRQTINSIETGRYEPSLPLAIKLAHLFGMHVEDLFLLPEKELPRPVKHDVLFKGKQSNV